MSRSSEFVHAIVAWSRIASLGPVYIRANHTPSDNFFLLRINNLCTPLCSPRAKSCYLELERITKMSALAVTDRAAINRANAQHSTGPRTPEGKAPSSQNALGHGLTSRIALLPS